MLFVVFEIGDERYALEASQVSEILPLVRVRPVPHAPEGIVGVFDLRGRPIPVVDLSVLMQRRPAARLLSTRLIVVRYPDNGGTTQPLALVAEKATRTIRREPSAFVDSGITGERRQFAAAMAIDDAGLIQRVSLTELLPVEVRRALFTNAEPQCPLPSSSIS